MHTTLLVSFTVAVISLIRLPPDRGLADKHCSGVKGQKVRLTYAFTSNTDGSEKLKPFIIGKAKKPHAFGKKTGPQLGFYYWNNAKFSGHIVPDGL
jgi:hypothetical protein